MKNNNHINLRPWRPGTSGNPHGRKPGSKNISTIVRELLAEEVQEGVIQDESGKYKGHSYAKAMVIAMVSKAVSGDVSAAKWVSEQAGMNSGSDRSLFEQDKLQIEIVKSNHLQ